MAAYNHHWHKHPPARWLKSNTYWLVGTSQSYSGRHSFSWACNLAHTTPDKTRQIKPFTAPNKCRPLTYAVFGLVA
jgi:hypothetical protein